MNYFTWGWNEHLNVPAIIDACRGKPNVKPFLVKSGSSSTNRLILADNLQHAKDIYIDVNRQDIEMCEAWGEEFEMPEIVEWKDGE